jgi:hypothetical protein
MKVAPFVRSGPVNHKDIQGCAAGLSLGDVGHASRLAQIALIIILRLGKMKKEIIA